MSLKASPLASARPPEITFVALCRSGTIAAGRGQRHETRMRRQGRGRGRADSTFALPPPAAASNEAMRMVATIFVPAATSTVVIALPA